MKRIFFIVVFISLLFSCKKNQEGIIFSYAETQCADLWHDLEGAFDMSREQRICTFLESEGIDFSDLSVENYGEGMIFCAACSCASGFKITLTSSETFSSPLEDLGLTAE